MPKERPFNHDSNNLFESCGLTEEEVEYCVCLIHSHLKESATLSQVTEVIEELLLTDPEVAEELGILRTICLLTCRGMSKQ